MDGENNRDESDALQMLSETLQRCADDFETVWREALDEQHSAETHKFLTHIIQMQRGLLRDWMQRIPDRGHSVDQGPPDAPAKTIVVPAPDREEFPAEPSTIVRQPDAPPVVTATSADPVAEALADAEADTERGASFSLRSDVGPVHAADFETWAYTGPPVNDVFVPPEVEGYEILEEVGRGGMGVVYRARQRGLNRIVALKMILAGPHASPEQLVRFRGEAEAAAQLQHSNIVQIYGVGDQNGLPYFTLEFVDGVPLSTQMRSMPQVPKKASAVIEKLARAMDYAHQQGIVHRDLKPANILLSNDGIPKIADFGLAKQMDGDSTTTKTGTVLGTHNYMAPEQGRGDKDVGPPADVYALGSILYEMLTGRPPFLAAKAVDTVMRLMTQEPVPPSRLAENVPRDLETICLRCR
ncbi:MAG: serine/threonine-protein kinase, partial [Planctomycetaceae bacterium]